MILFRQETLRIFACVSLYAMLTVACHTPGDEKPRTTLAKTLEQLIEFCL